jgi:hypothetical protein
MRPNHFFLTTHELQKKENAQVQLVVFYLTNLSIEWVRLAMLCQKDQVLFKLRKPTIQYVHRRSLRGSEEKQALPDPARHLVS